MDRFKRSRHCGNGACVEVAVASEEVLVRSSTDPEGPVISFTHDEWEAFIAGIKDGDFAIQ